MLTKKKKILILCTMLVLLVVTGYLNIALNNSVVDTGGKTSDGGGTVTANFFVTYRARMTAVRQETLLYYQAIIDNKTSTAEAKAYAQSKRDEIVATMNLESTLEGLIGIRGYEEVIVVCSNSYVDIIVKCAELSDAEVAQIVEIIQSQTNKDIDFIKIIPVE